jgi:pimeloyl-ACP methyl ester carboxylesterase
VSAIDVVRVPARGLTFDVRVGGPAGGRPVLLLHGFPEHALMWDGLAGRLHELGLRTFAPDQRGYSPGARPPEVGAYAVPEVAADGPAILDALGVTGPVDLIGHDIGAYAGWYLAGHHPGRVRRYVAMSVPHPVSYGRALAEDAEQQRKSAYIQVVRRPGTGERAMLEDDGAALKAAFAGSGLTDAQVAAYVAPFQDDGALTPVLNWYRAMRRDTPFPAVAVPTTYLWGSEDLAVSRAAAEGCGRHVTGPYEFVELPGVSHWMVEQDLDGVAAVVGPFLTATG